MYTIRSSRPADLPKLAGVERRAGMLFAGTPHSFLCTAPTLDPRILERQHQLDAVRIAADASDEPVGFAVAGELGEEAYLYEIDVDPEHGRRGLGRRLLRAVIDWAEGSGYPTLTLSTFVELPWNAPFYAKLGFEIVPAAELTPIMRETRVYEAKAGFQMDRRVFMRRVGRSAATPPDA